jgi:aminoglycoside phosphotransferase (APT) family kinase protein
VTAPTAPAAGVHLPWAQVPAAVRSWAAGIGGGDAPQAVRDLPGGFSPGATSLLEWPNRSLFVKAVGPELNPESPHMHRREAVVSAALPRSPRFPRLLEVYDDGAWVALAFEAVEGRPPRHPWDSGELTLVADALAAMHDELTPSPVPDLDPLSVFAVRLFGGWSTLASVGAPARLDPWAAAHLDQLAELESGWPEACAGSTLVHGDVRADNVLIAGERVVFVDWPFGSIGNAAFDLVGWAPSVVLEGGPAPEELLALHAPSRLADPAAVTVLLAAISGFFVSRSLEPAGPGLPTLRAFQAAQGAVALEWLRRRTGW